MCGTNIAKIVDVEAVASFAAGFPNVVIAKTYKYMCSNPGQEMITQDIREHQLNRVVVAACSPNMHERTFRSALRSAGLNQYLLEMANIREQCSWVHKDGKEATEKAKALVHAAIRRVELHEELESMSVNMCPNVLVIGGGIAGMTLALEVADAGNFVHLVEKNDHLGGNLARVDLTAPYLYSARDLLTERMTRIRDSKQVQVYLQSAVKSLNGYVGNFKLTLSRRPPERSSQGAVADRQAFEALAPASYVPFAGVLPEALPSAAREWVQETGVVVFATGFQPYAPQEGEYGYLKQPDVITLPELIRRMAEEASSGRRLAVGGREIRRVAFIHCVGSRQIPGIHDPGPDGRLNEYCSRTCCSATLQAAVRIRETYPDTQVFEFYRDIRTYGRGQEEVYDRASKANVIFFRFEPEAPPVVERAGGKDFPLRVRVNDTLTFGEELSAEVDLVVLAVGMEPSPIVDLVEAMKLPVGVDRFLQEVHPKLRPVEVANTGILLAGTCQAPMEVGEACAAAQAAAAKATSLLVKGYVELDPFVAEVRAELCTGHGACAEVCPIEGAITLTAADQGRKARVNPALCTGCGICVPECPEKAIEVKGWTLKQYEEMVDAIVAA